MSREKYLWKRRKNPEDKKGFWSFQISVPLELHGKFRSATGKPLAKIVEALGVDSLTEARKLRDQKLVEWQARFDRARQDAPLSIVEIEAEAREVYHSLLDELETSGQHKEAKDFIEQIGMTEEESSIFTLQCILEEALSRIRSTCIVSTGIEVIFTFGGFEDVGADFERTHQAGDGSLGDFAQMSFQF